MFISFPARLLSSLASGHDGGHQCSKSNLPCGMYWRLTFTCPQPFYLRVACWAYCLRPLQSPKLTHISFGARPHFQRNHRSLNTTRQQGESYCLLLIWLRWGGAFHCCINWSSCIISFEASELFYGKINMAFSLDELRWWKTPFINLSNSSLWKDLQVNDLCCWSIKMIIKALKRIFKANVRRETCLIC